MKIISKYKDYYDYLGGIIGIDEKYTLDRTNYHLKLYTPGNYQKTELHIGEYMIEGMWYNHVCLFGIDIEKFSNQEKEIYYIEDSSKYNKDNSWIVPYAKSSYSCFYKEPIYLGEKSPTWKKNHPLLIKTSYKDYSINPILKDYNVSSYINAEKCWHYLYDWFSKREDRKEKEIIVSNDVKIVSHGFDKKTSFRKM